MSYASYNANPGGRRVGDCTVRAIATAMDRPWEEIYIDLAMEGLRMYDLPSANSVWGTYLRKNGFTREALPNTCPDCYTVGQFADEHPEGTYILALQGHVVCVKDGVVLDTWDSSEETPLYFWMKG